MHQIFLDDMQEIYSRSIDWAMLKNKSVMVTGAYGMLASYAVFMLVYLNEHHNFNIKIIALGRSEEKAKQRFNEYFKRGYFVFIESDMSDLSDLTIPVDYIIHAASHASSQYYATDPVGVTLPNVLGTYQLCMLAARRPIKSMIFVSSGEVYGDIDKPMVAEADIGISNPLDIRYCYGESKRMGECLINCYYNQYKVPGKIVRLGHTYGPTMDIKYDKRVFSEFVGNIVRNENILIKSDGKGVRSFLYAADAVAAFYQVLLHGVNAEAYNINNMSGTLTIGELAQQLCNMYPEKNLCVEYGARAASESYIEAKQKGNTVVDASKLHALGWQVKYNVKEGFGRTINYFMSIA